MLDQTPYAQWLGSTFGDFRLEQLLGFSALGPLFAARTGAAPAAFLVRVLAVPPAQTAQTAGVYQDHLERQAGHIASLRHPYILPLVSYGIDQGLPYLVWPQPTARSLTTRLAQSGPLDVVTVGRYLDQIASALEYAHERQTVHRNLSTDCIYLQMDGQLAVADFGARRIFELLSPGEAASRFLGSVEACAPEQLQSGRVDTYTDVYALGGVTFRLLTGQPPFTGQTFEALANEHLYASPPSPGRLRPGIPAELDNVLAAALAKDPRQRLRHPGELANAYNAVVAPANAARVPFAVGATLAPTGPAAQFGSRAPVSAATTRTSLLPGRSATQPASPAQPAPSGPLALLGGGRLPLAGVLLLVLLGGGLFLVEGGHLSAPTHATGSATFFDSPGGPSGATDAVTLKLQGLASPPSGSRYKAWLINQQTEQVVSLGTLAAGSGQSYSLTYTSPGANNQSGANLLAEGNQIEISEERSDVPAPAGQVILSGAFPRESFVHIQHILVSFPTTPGKIGLLVGLLEQSAALNAQAAALQTAASSGDAAKVQCRAQNIVDILEGSHGRHYHLLSAACAAQGILPVADGFGLLASPATPASGGSAAHTGYLAAAADHASLAATTPDATAAAKAHVQQVETAIAGMKGIDTTADTAAVRLLTAPGDATAVAQVVSACAQAYDGGGTTTAQTSSTGPDALTAYTQGQQMATLTLTAPH